MSKQKLGGNMQNKKLQPMVAFSQTGVHREEDKVEAWSGRWLKNEYLYSGYWSCLPFCYCITHQVAEQ